MGYVIRYGEDIPDSVPVRAGKYGNVAAVLVIMACAAVGGFLLQKQVREAVMPWTRESVQNAFSEFSSDVWEGASFRDALEDFCREILDEAKEVS